MIERRALARHKTFIKGRIYFNNRLSSMDCIVRDITANGGRLECSENVTLPELFELYIPHKDEYFRARIEWRKGNNLGVSWTPEQSERQRPAHEGADPIADRLARIEHDVALLKKRLDALQEM
ncbi:MAG: PilZ domain-containing protein [Xanthobacteraceae bacterium]|nr:PilZ domain-containing protein [Xanthobacteraceae bacterium]